MIWHGRRIRLIANRLKSIFSIVCFCSRCTACHRPGAAGTWHPTAALVIEIVSPGDESWDKLPFYAAHHVDEVLILDPEEHAVHWLGLTGDEYRPIERSTLIDLGQSDLAGQIDWP